MGSKRKSSGDPCGSPGHTSSGFFGSRGIFFYKGGSRGIAGGRFLSCFTTSALQVPPGSLLYLPKTLSGCVWTPKKTNNCRFFEVFGRVPCRFFLCHDGSWEPFLGTGKASSQGDIRGIQIFHSFLTQMSLALGHLGKDPISTYMHTWINPFSFSINT